MTEELYSAEAANDGTWNDEGEASPHSSTASSAAARQWSRMCPV